MVKAHVAMAPSLPIYLVTKIIKSMHISDQYTTAMNTFDSESCDEIADFFARDNYVGSLTYFLEDEVAGIDDNWVTKHGQTLVGESTYFVKMNTCVSNLPEWDIPTKGVHKIHVWRKLWEAGMASDYSIRITRTITTDYEDVQVCLAVRNVEGSSTEFIVSLDVLAWEVKGFSELIARGTRDTKVKLGEFTDIVLAEGEPEVEGVHRSDIYYNKYKDGTFVEFTDPPECDYDFYKFGIDAVTLNQILCYSRVDQ